MRKYLQKIKVELSALRIALRENLVPWPVKALIAITVAYAFSPIDLIPDFIPVLGLLDDVIIIPLLIFLIVKMIPQKTMEQCRLKAAQEKLEKKPNWIAGTVIILIWIAGLLALWYWWRNSSAAEPYFSWIGTL